VAITHAREPNDNKLAEKCPPGLIDLILGGHDHFYFHSLINGTHVLRSGTDFKQLSYIEAWRKEDKCGGWDFTITRHDIVRSIAEDEEAVKLISKLTSSLKDKLEKPVGYTAAPLDGRFTTVRTKESNLGNFVSDLMRFYYDADCALMASGTIRGDQIYPPGPLRMKDIMNCFPFEDPVVVLRITGEAILSALENSVSLVPALEGRFPQVSNIHFKYHPESPIGSRIKSVEVHDEPLKLEAYYKVATRGYMARGKDGFNSLLVMSEGGTAEELVSEENGVLISTILRQYFLSLKVLGRWHRWGPSLGRHWDGVHDKLHKGGKVKESRPVDKGQRPPKRTRHGDSKHDDASAVKPHHKPHHHMKPHLHQDYHEDAHYSDSDTDASDAELMTSLQDYEPHPQHHHLATHGDLDRDMHLARSVAKKWMRLAGIKREHVGTVESEEEEFMPGWTRGIAPRVEGRIRIVGQERKESVSN
jgi:5'-nucleotidase